MSLTVRILSRADAQLLQSVAAGVFDHGVDPARCREFLDDPRHHLAVAMDSGVIVGMASAVHYVHPDKQPELWVNEVAVAAEHRGRGVAKQLVRLLLTRGRELGCSEAWVLTDRANEPAMRLYASCGAEPAPRDQVMFTFKLR